MIFSARLQRIPQLATQLPFHGKGATANVRRAGCKKQLGNRKEATILLSGLLRTYNEEANLPKSLDNLLSFCDEVVISDGGSTDGTHDIVCAYQGAGFAITWLDFPGGSISKNVHFNHAGSQFNFGLARCRGEWVITCDTDIIHCDYVRTHLRRILRTTPHDALLMYGVHLVRDWGHYMSDAGTGPGQIQLFRNKEGVKFPNRAEHVAFVDHFEWESLGITRGGIYHWGYVDRGVEIAKTKLRHTAMPNDDAYKAVAANPQKHQPTPIPWVRCHANCIVCWMEEDAAGRMVKDAVIRREEIASAMRFTEENFSAALLSNDKDCIGMQYERLEELRIKASVTGRRASAMEARVKEMSR